MSLDLVVTVARRELAEISRNRWFWAYAGGFALVSAALTLLGIPGSQVVGAGGFGRTAASLVALAQTLIPLMALTMGAQTVAGATERGSMRFLLSHPIGRSEVIAGTFIGQAAGLIGAIAAGFGTAAVAGGLLGAGGDPVALGYLAGLSAILATAMLAVGLAIGSAAPRASAAVGTAVLVWLLLVFVGDLGVMGTAVATRMPVEALFVSVIANPVEAYRIAAVPTFGSSLDVLGPAGNFAVDTLGAMTPLVAVGIMAVWMAFGALLAGRFFSRKDIA